MLQIVPITFRAAKAFIQEHHRHNKPPTGWKFGVGVTENGELVGVATAGRPIARHMDDGLTLEVNRTCTNGTRNANSKLYGAIWQAGKAMGYTRCITYTQADEDGCSLRAVGWERVKELKPRKNWAASSSASLAAKANRDASEPSGVPRVLWMIQRGHKKGDR